MPSNDNINCSYDKENLCIYYNTYTYIYNRKDCNDKLNFVRFRIYFNWIYVQTIINVWRMFTILSTDWKCSRISLVRTIDFPLRCGADGITRAFLGWGPNLNYKYVGDNGINVIRSKARLIWKFENTASLHWIVPCELICQFINRLRTT